jgi:hypothetical protein
MISSGQPVGGDAVGGHSAGPFLGFENRGPVAHGSQIIGARQSCRAGADDGYLVGFVFGRRLLQRPCTGSHLVVGQKPFQGADGNRFVQPSAPAVLLTGANANPPDGARHGAVFTHARQGFIELSHADAFDVGGNIDVGRAGTDAGRRNRGFKRLGLDAAFCRHRGGEFVGIAVHDFQSRRGQAPAHIAAGRFGDKACQPADLIQVIRLSLSVANPVHDQVHPLGAFPAGRALTAGFQGHLFDVSAQQIHGIDIIVPNHKTFPSQQCFERGEIGRRICRFPNQIHKFRTTLRTTTFSLILIIYDGGLTKTSKVEKWGKWRKRHLVSIGLWVHSTFPPGYARFGNLLK